MGIMSIASLPNKYRTKEICELLDISKKTLYDWEARGIIPPADRDWRGWRVYDDTHVEAIMGYQRQKAAKVSLSTREEVN